MKEKTFRLIDLAAKPNVNSVEIGQLKRELTNATRLVSAPNSGGQMEDQKLAFKAWIASMSCVLADMMDLGPIHDEIIDAILSDHRNTLLLASRGSGKSTLTGMYVLWDLFQNYTTTILVVSRGEDRAKDMLKGVKSFLDLHPLVNHMRPDEAQRDNVSEIEIGPAKGTLGRGMSLRSIGITGQLTGLRAHKIIADDCEGPNHETAPAVDRLMDQVAEFQMIRIPGGRILFLGTPQSEFSLYGRLARTGQYEVHRACLVEEDILDRRKSGADWLKTTVLSSRWPDRFSDQDLMQTRASLSERLWKLHFLLDLSETKDAAPPFRLRDLPILDWPSKTRAAPVTFQKGGEKLHGLPRGSASDDDDWHLCANVSNDVSPYQMTIAAVDPARGLESGASDAIGLSIVSLSLGGRGVIRVARGVRAKTVEEAILETARVIAEYRATSLVVESINEGLFGPTLQKALAQYGYPMSFRAVTGGNMKKGRRVIEQVGSALATGRVAIAKDVLEHGDASEFVTQYSGFSMDARKLRWDDIIDSLAFALAELKGALSVDSEEEIALFQRERFEDLVRMPKRSAPYSAAELEELISEDETETRLRGQLECALSLQQYDLARGVESETLAKKIASLRRQLKEVQAARLRWCRPPEDMISREQETPL